MKLRLRVRLAGIVAALLLSSASQAGAQPAGVRVLHNEAAAAGAALQRSLAAPHALLVTSDEAPLAVAADSAIQTGLVLVSRDGGSAAVSGIVRGDVTMVGGDLFLHPGARIEGRAVAIGGGVYPSSLAHARDGTESYRDVTFDLTGVAGEQLFVSRVAPQEQPPLVAFPLGLGIRVPSYERSSGLSVPWGPVVTLYRMRAELQPVLTWRSHIGAIDPGVTARAFVGRSGRADLMLARGTFTNDGWIRSDLLNSAVALALGRDTRNYYRADRAEARFTIRLELPRARLEPFVGVRAERGWPVGPDSVATGAPWSFLGRRSAEGMVRPNPPVQRGTITSALAGSAMQWEDMGVRTSARLILEAAPSSPAGGFVQGTVDVKVSFPTFSSQWFELEAHVVGTGGSAPRQRFAYLGGSPTLPTEPLLGRGGDQLLFLETTYLVPVDRISLPLIGSPTVYVRHAIGGAGRSMIPELVQNVGAGIRISLLKAEAMVDPDTRKWALSAGLSLGR